MAWLPLGPDFTFQPNDPNFLRLSRRNESGRQAMVKAIAVDPTDAQTIYVLQNPWPGGSGGFRSDDGGQSWTSIIDDLTPGHWVDFSPTAIAVNPSNSSTIYLGWNDGTFFTSASKGSPGSWVAGGSIASRATISSIVIDPATAASATPTLYAGCGDDVYVSVDGGASWSGTNAGGQADSLVVDFSSSPPNFYAGIDNVGLLFSTDPTVGWNNLNLRGIGLPASGFEAILVDVCANNPQRVYAWFAKRDQTVGLFTTSSASTRWTQVIAAGTPDPGQGLYTFAFAVCPNSPGNGTNDILLFGGLWVSRLTDQTGAGTWETTDDNVALHADQHAFAFAPQSGSAFPAVFIGCDGGLAKSTQLANPASSLTLPAGDPYDDLAAYADSPVFENLNHGMQASALFAFSGNVAMPAINYMACGDTGVAGSTGALGWRALANADANSVTASPGPNGITVWGDDGFYSGWPGYRIIALTDTGAYSTTGPFAYFNGSPVTRASYDFRLDENGLCVCGVTARVNSGSLMTPVSAAGTQAVTPSSMQNVTVGAMLVIDPGTKSEDLVQVISLPTPTSFTATFAYTHGAGAPVEYQPTFVARIDRTGTVTQLSQDFQNRWPALLTMSATNPNLLVCGVLDQNYTDGAVFFTTNASTANASTIWVEASSGVPFPSDNTDPLAAVVIDAAGSIYVMLTLASSPLYEISGTTWTAIATTLPQLIGYEFGPVVADPIQPGVLYATINNNVYVVTIANGTATWTAITGNLPGVQVYALWIGNVGTPSVPRVLLRAGIPARGVYELDVTPNAMPPALALYMRGHMMDLHWFPQIIDGVPNPYDPSELLYHYQSADIKVDPQQQVSGQTFFTTDPEDPLPIDHVAFGELSSNAANLPQQDVANVHVQVNNASTTASGPDWVWAIYCQGAAGLASLATSQSNNNAFPFWSQFLADGTIVPALPVDSPWTSVGAPVQLTAIDAAHPKVASFTWTIPATVMGNHHCLVAFANCAGSPLTNMTSDDVDSLVLQNRQISQKNLMIGPPLPPSPSMGSPKRRLPIVFNNPLGKTRVANLRFDLRTLAPHVRARIGLSDVAFTKPVETSLHEFERIERVALDSPFVTHVFATSGGRSATIDGIAIPPFGSHLAEILVEHGADLEPGSTHRFHVQQIVDGKVVGGIVIVIPIEGRLRQKAVTVRHDDAEETGVRRRFAPWARKAIDARAKLLRRPIPS